MNPRQTARPWRRNPLWDPVKAANGPIVDANGADVIEPSEWLMIEEQDIDLIIAAVNAYAP